MLNALAHIVVFVAGLSLVVFILFSAIRTFVLPRSARDPLTTLIFATTRRLFRLINGRALTYEQRDRTMALYAPVTVLLMPVVWLALVGFGYALMYRALGVSSFIAAIQVSGSSLLTLGFDQVFGIPTVFLEFSEAMVGLVLIALLIAYLPTMYSAFSQREAMVALLEVRAGSPPFCVEMFLRFHRLHSLEQLHDIWLDWERWFISVEETHTSLAPLSFFRSPQHDRSWVTAAGAVLDAAAMAASTLDIPRDTQADLCIRAGYIALRRICDFFELPYNANPRPDDPISVMRQEFDDAYDELAANGLPLKSDRDQAWRDFAGWRVNYDVPLLSLARLMMAPYAPWSSDRSISPARSLRFWGRKRRPRAAVPDSTRAM